ncbi:MAG: glycosyltransferase family 4 protein [Pseudomonadota bacterium]|nr:glycosyltransferase family 4 protein [Pseudomonadota bacterium]
MGLISTELHARIHEPDDSPAKGTDRLRAVVAAPGELWNLARKVSQETSADDAVFCSSEAGGLQLAAVCSERSVRPRIAVFVHNVDRPRARFALKWWHMADQVDLFFACTPRQVEFLRTYLKLSDDRVRQIWDHTDTQFFTPGPASEEKRRPLVVSVGLEQRDYRTLATATKDLDLDISISGFSEDAAPMTRTFPETLPDNMTRRFYSWPDLLQLYRDADVVVVSCHESRYAAGVQSLMEAMACGRPVIATATEGLKAYLDDSVTAICPGDAPAMRAAIQSALADRPGSEARAARGHDLAVRRYDMDRYVAEISDAMRSLL